MNWFNKINLNLLVSQKMTLLYVIDQIPLSEAQRNDLQGIVHLLDSLQDVCESQAAPAVPQGEPVAYLWKYIGKDPYPVQIHGKTGGYIARSIKEMNPENPPYPDTWKPETPLYPPAALPAAPSQGEPVTLTDEEIKELALPFGCFEYGDAQGHKRVDFARAIIAALREKEGK